MHAGQPGKSEAIQADGLGSTLLPAGSQPSRLGNAGQSAAQAAELYIGLLCQFEPASVLPFLQSNGDYRVQVKGTSWIKPDRTLNRERNIIMSPPLARA